VALYQGSSKYQKNSKKQKAPKQAVKEATKKAKREKVDLMRNARIGHISQVLYYSLTLPTTSR
jgi:hypothetical protein